MTLRAIVATCLVVATGCARPAIVALPSTSSDVLSDFAARATTQHGVTVEAWTRGWPDGSKLALGRSATPVYVRIENGGRTPLQVSRDAFELVAGTASFRALAPEEVAAGREDIRQRELRSGVLEPGEADSGFLYFEPVVGEWGFLHLRTLLVDASSGALVDSLDVPFGSGRQNRCTREGERGEPRSGETILFHGCLPRL